MSEDGINLPPKRVCLVQLNDILTLLPITQLPKAVPREGTATDDGNNKKPGRRSQEERKVALTSAMNSLRRERLGLEREKAEVNRERQTLAQERKLFEREKLALQRDKTQLIKDFATVEREKASLERERVSLQRERASLDWDKLMVTREKQRLKREQERNLILEQANSTQLDDRQKLKLLLQSLIEKI